MNVVRNDITIISGILFVYLFKLLYSYYLINQVFTL